MKRNNTNKLLGLALIGSFGLFNASTALAAPGVPIVNRATLAYDVNGAGQVGIESSDTGNSTPGVGLGGDTSFVEDRLLAFTVVRGGSTGSVAPGGTLQAVQYTLTNDGNGAQDFLLKGLNNVDGSTDPFGGSTDIFDGSSVQTFVESGGVAGYDVTDTAAFVANLAAGASIDVYVVSTIPTLQTTDGVTPLINGDTSVMTLLAQVATAGGTGDGSGAITNDDNNHISPAGTGFTNGAGSFAIGTANNIADNATTEQVVFGDAAALDGSQDSAGGVDGASNGQYSAFSSYTIETAVLSVTKVSAALWDPINLASNPKSIPGGYVQYTITIENTGVADADLTILTDVLAATLDLDADLGDGTAANNPANAVGNSVQIVHSNAASAFCTAGSDADGCDYTGGSGGTLTVDIHQVMDPTDVNANDTLATGETLTITFNVIIQ